MVHAAMAQATMGLSPAALGLAFADWAIHLASSPGKLTELSLRGWTTAAGLADAAGGQEPPPGPSAGVAPAPLDVPAAELRFRGEAWQELPYRHWYQGFLQVEAWWSQATHGIAGVSPHHEKVVSFVIRQSLDMASPSNWPWTNPEVVRETVRTGGQNLVSGFANWQDDWTRSITKRQPSGSGVLQVGRDLAATPGSVVFRNHLMELIQYRPSTETVMDEPVLVVPAWIMKYYILDLSPHNSLIRHLVESGRTVFCISWRNVTAEDRDIAFDDYRRQGVLAALDAISSIVPAAKVHLAGYCLGGTLVSMTAAAMAADGDDRLESLTLLAAQTDFSEPGELDLFIDESEVSFLEDMMWEHGTLDARQMSGAFQLLQSNDLIWSRMIHDYLMGQRTATFDLMSWNADATRMPYRMHSEYLRGLLLNNDLACGRYQIEGRPIAIQNVRVPIFGVGTERDHVAPWRSVYKIHALAESPVTFLLTSGGHNAGIVSEPGHPNRHFRMSTTSFGDPFLGPEAWERATPPQDGSWWPAWVEWLAQNSAAVPRRASPRTAGSQAYPPLGDAPGTYVFQS